MPFEIGWFSTGKDRQALKLLEETFEAIRGGKIKELQISYVFCNREEGENRESDEFINFVKKISIPIICFSSRKFKPELRKKALSEARKNNFQPINSWRILYDDRIIEMIKDKKTKVIFLAGYMLILGEKLCREFTILNLHPALPEGPRGTWQEVIWQLIKKRATKTGIMIHRVTPELDAGPAFTYCEFPLKGKKFDPLWKRMEKKLNDKTLPQIKKEEGEREPLFMAIRQEQKKREIPLVLSTLKLLAERKLNPETIKKPIFLKV